MPPSSPLGGRLRTSTQPSARTTTNAAPRRSFPSRFGALRGKRLRIAAPPRRAIVHPGAERAGRLLRRADGGAEVHHRLREIAGARVRRERLRQRADLRLGRRQLFLDREQPRHHPLDIAVDRHRAADRRRSPRSRPRYRRRCPAARGARPRSAESPPRSRHRPRAGMQVAGARVVAEPGPEPQHVVERRRRQRADVRPAREEAREIGPDRLHGGLLQHDFGQPDPVGIVASPGLARHGSTRRWRSYQASRVAGCRLRTRFCACDRHASAVPALLAATVMAIRYDRAARHEQAWKQAWKTQARPLADILRNTIKDAFAKQGFAADRAGHPLGRDRRAGDRRPLRAREDPVAAALRQRGPAARHPGAAGRRPDGDRDPAPVAGHPRAREPLLRLAGGDRPAAAAGAAAAAARNKPVREPDRESGGPQSRPR